MKKITDYDTQVYTYCLLFVTMFFVIMSMAHGLVKTEGPHLNQS